MASSEFAVQIDNFFADRKVQRLLNLARETRPLRVCFPREIPISRFLAWIFDPWQGHGLQDTPLRRLLAAAGRNADDALLELKVRRHLGSAFLATYSFMGCIVQKEVHLGATGGRLDVLVLEPKTKLLIAIENKFGAREGPNQLTKYADALRRTYPDWTRVLVFLDVYGEPPGDEPPGGAPPASIQRLILTSSALSGIAPSLSTCS